MAFTDTERTELRRYCGYPAFGSGSAGYQGWRFFQAYGLMEFRLSHLTDAEETVARRFLVTLEALELAIPAAAETLDTAVAAVWTRNANEITERTRLLDDWRRRLCGFLGLPPGPGLSQGGMRLVV